MASSNPVPGGGSVAAHAGAIAAALAQMVAGLT
ncbi:MAG: cyclodeaminase/cyclohydrolase family protein, partial [Gemmatimonadota bacterium]|nr:cyclodeaminase/cyclohydrolase family protein [Gemmatimonadota bacterium]